MTVAELKQALDLLPPDLPVVFHDTEEGPTIICGVHETEDSVMDLSVKQKPFASPIRVPVKVALLLFGERLNSVTLKK